jgi:hypothetical protein
MNFIKNNFTDENEMILACPVCGFEYTHLLKVSEYRSDKNSEERLGVALSFECENGHVFEYMLDNHKGYTVSTFSVEDK